MPQPNLICNKSFEEAIEIFQIEFTKESSIENKKTCLRYIVNAYEEIMKNAKPAKYNNYLINKTNASEALKSFSSSSCSSSPETTKLFHAGTKKEPKQATQQKMAPTSYDSLKGSKQAIIDKIFDPKAPNTVSFLEFKNLWEYIHGDNSVHEDTGSSHKKLIAGDKTFGTFSHGDSMLFGPSIIGQLRIPLFETGFAPPGTVLTRFSS